MNTTLQTTSCRGLAATRRRPLSALAGVAALLALCTGCGADASDAVAGVDWNTQSAHSVNGYEVESRIHSDHTSIQAGDVSFTFANKGTIVHEVVLIKSDDPNGQIPLEGNNRLNEDAPNSLNVGETDEMDPGKVVTFTAHLAPGAYQLVCNIAGHYAAGMHMSFTVTG